MPTTTTSSCETADHGNPIASTHARYCTSQFIISQNTIHSVIYIVYKYGVYERCGSCVVQQCMMMKERDGRKSHTISGHQPHLCTRTYVEVFSMRPICTHTCSVPCMNALQNVSHSLLFRGFLLNDRDA